MTMAPASPRKMPSKDDVSHLHHSPRDPPGTPPVSSSMLEKSDRSTPVGSPLSINASPTKIHSSFNRSLLPPPRAPRVLFPPNSSDRSNHEKRHKSPPSVKRKGSEKAVFLWEVEDEDDIPSLSDSSAEHESAQVIPGIDMAVLSGNIGSPMKKTSLSVRGVGIDVASDPGQAYSKPATKKETSSFDAAGPTSPQSRRSTWDVSPSKRGINTTKAQPSGNIPQSPDEHTARLREIMVKREKKEKRKKTKKRCNTDDSDVSGVSSNTRTSSRGSYEDDPMTYLNEILTKSEKEKKSFDAISAVGSKASKGSTVSSLGSQSSSGKWRDAKIEKKYPTVVDAHRGSDVSSDISGTSNTSSSIFAATRSKLKGYLKSYKKSDKKKKMQKDPNKSTKLAASSQLTPSREVPMNTEKTEGTPGTLFSIEESDSDSPLRKISSNSPRTPLSSSRKSFEDKVSLLATPPPSSSGPKASLHNIHEAAESETDTIVADLPWRYDGKDVTLEDDKPNSELKRVGLYSGPVNGLIQPHGKGKLVLEAYSTEEFHGTWEDGILVTPLSTEEKEPVTDDDSYKDDGLDGLVLYQSRGRMREEPPHTENSAEFNMNAPQATNIKYAVNKHHNGNRFRGKKSRKSRPKRLSRYNLGDACRTPQDMIICKSKDTSTESVSLLKKWDGAFIKRSSGVWTYAILIERALQPVDVVKKRLEYFYWTAGQKVDPRYEMQDSMLFAIDEEGGTKIIPKHAWAKYVRRIQHTTIPNIPRRILNHDLPTEIAVDGNSQDIDDSGRECDEKVQGVVYPY